MKSGLMWAVLVSFFRLYLSLILLNATHAGILPTLTGGSLFFHPRFNVARDGPVVESQLRRVLGCSITTSISMAAPGRDQDSGGGYGYGYDCTAKVRCSKGTLSFHKLSSPLFYYYLCIPLFIHLFEYLSLYAYTVLFDSQA